MAGKFVIAAEVKPEINDWGTLGWLSNPPTTGARDLTVIDVRLAPGKGHNFHKHPDQEEEGGVVDRTREADPRLRGCRVHSGRHGPRLVPCR